MSRPPNADPPDGPRDSGLDEAERAVHEVLQSVQQKAAGSVRATRKSRRIHVDGRHLALLAVCAFGAYVWIGNPSWLRILTTRAPSFRSFEHGYGTAVSLRHELVTDTRRDGGRTATTAAAADSTIAIARVDSSALLVYALSGSPGRGSLARVAQDSLALFVADGIRRMKLFQPEAPGN